MRYKNVNTAADEVDCCITNVRALLSAIDDKLRFYLTDKSITGPYWELVKYHTLTIQTLLSMADSYLADAEEAQSQVTDTLYGVGEAQACERG